MSEVKELPKGWEWVEASTILDIRDGTHNTPQYVKNGGVPLITSKNLKKDIIDFTKVDYISKEDHLEISKRSKVDQGDILFAMIGTIGNPAIIKGGTDFSIKNVALFKKNTSIILSGYLVNFLRSSLFEKQLTDRKLLKGTTQKFIPLGNLRKLNIPLPPLEAQQAIVSKIEELFSEVDKGIETLRTAQQQLKTYRQSVLKWAFEGKLTEEWRKKNTKKVKGTVPKVGTQPNGGLPERWEWVKITDLVPKDKHSLKAGPFGSSLKKEHYVSKGYKVYGQEQVISGDPYFGDYYIDKEKYKELFTNRIKPFDILISLVGTVGKVLILPANCDEGIINPRLIKVSLDRNVYLSSFFKYYFESSKVKSFYSGETRGTTMDVLNLGIIKTIDFPLCSIQEQQAIVEEIESRLSVADKMEESIATSLQQAEALKQSILKMAFEGRLVSEEKQKPKVTNKAKQDYFIQLQYLGLVARTSKAKKIEHGEMTIAKYMYLVDRLYDVPTGFKYTRFHLGPYAIEMKKVVNNKTYFKKQKGSIEVLKQETLFKYNNQYKVQIETGVGELAEIFAKYSPPERADKTELLATVCMVIEDIKSTDLKAVRASMKEWKIDLKTSPYKNKSEKFTEAETKKCLAFIIDKGWDKKLI